MAVRLDSAGVHMAKVALGGVLGGVVQGATLSLVGCWGWPQSPCGERVNVSMDGKLVTSSLFRDGAVKPESESNKLY